MTAGYWSFSVVVGPVFRTLSVFFCDLACQLGLPSLRGRQIEYQPFYLGLCRARSVIHLCWVAGNAVIPYGR